MRLIKEFFKPRLKCDRVGHQEEEIIENGYVYPSTFGVAAEGIKKFKRCARCYIEMSKPIYEEKEYIHSLSMPSNDWKILKANGFLKI